MVDPVSTTALVKAGFDIAAFGVSKMAKAVGSLYGTAKNLNVYIDEHIDTLKASKDESTAATGNVLEGGPTRNCSASSSSRQSTSAARPERSS